MSKARHLVPLVVLIAGMIASPYWGYAAPPADWRPLPPVVNTGGRLGAVAAFESPQLARQAGARWERINFWWNSLQPNSADDWDWSGLVITDTQVAADVAAGISPVGLLGNPPQWATRNGSVPKNLSLGINDPQNYWARFVSTLARRYAGRIDNWIVWNEPDIDPGRPGSTWAGSEGEYYDLLKAASLAARAANPKAKIVFAGTTYFADFNVGRPLFLERVLSAARDGDPTAAANGYYFDAVDLHIYSAVYEIANIAEKNRAVLRRFGLDKPIWVGEANTVPWDDPVANLPRGGFRATLDEQASFIIEAFAMAVASGVDRFEVYKMLDGAIERNEPYGLVRNDGSVRPAYLAYQVAAKYLDRPGKVTHRRDGDINYVVWERDGARTTVLWSGSPNAVTATIAPIGTKAISVDKYGNETSLDPRKGNYVVALAPATANTVDGQPNVYLIGGDPRILVEEGVGEAIADGGSLYYPITGQHVAGLFLDYFQKRGGLRTFGYPISRRFFLLGSEVQFFQRQVMQVRQDGRIGTLNILDSDLMPYTKMNGAVLPPIDSRLQKAAPMPGTTSYAQLSLRFVSDNVPDLWNGVRVSFLQTYTKTVKLEEAFPGKLTQLNLLPGINLELWGMPTSVPARDPNNSDFIFQRFQRGVMHYDRTTGGTQGVLLAAYLQALITGQDLPPDLAAQASASRFYLQYDNRKPNGLSRPAQVPGTNMKDAFEREQFGQMAPATRP